MTPEQAIAGLDAMLSRIGERVNAIATEVDAVRAEWEALGRIGGQRADHGAQLLGRLTPGLSELIHFAQVCRTQIARMQADPFGQKEARMIRDLTDAQLDQRVDLVEQLLHKADPKDMPYLTRTFQALIDEQVRRDLEAMYPDAKDRMIPVNYDALKARYPGMLLLFRHGQAYVLYGDDAETAGGILGLDLSRWSEESPTLFLSFVHHHLETYLRKLLAAGQRIAVCDEEHA